VKELEDQVRGLSVQPSTSQHDASHNTDRLMKEEERSLQGELDPLGQHGSNRKYYCWSFATRTSSQGSNQAYGAPSTFYFADQLASYLNIAIKHCNGLGIHHVPLQYDMQAFESPNSSLSGAEHLDMANLVADGDLLDLLLDFEDITEQ
jgi:hypothetical protein